MRRLAALCAVALLSVLLPGAATAGPVAGDAVILATHYGGKFRDFQLYVAPHVPTLEPVPLLIAMHGLYSDPQTTEAASGFDAVADSEDVAVVYPYGLNGSWAAGTCCGKSAADHVDDVGLLVHIVQMVSAVRPIDPRRVYVAGFSNGGMMALRAVCDRPDVFAAAVSVAGTLQTPCAAGRPVNALLINGTADATVPYAGLRYSRFLKTALASVPAAAATLARRDRCQGSTLAAPSSRYTVRTYVGCAPGSSLQVVAARGVGHRWPTRDRDHIDAGRIAWQFLSTRSLPG
jgi:polyhydroxybutyrate depolymerase